MIKLKGKIIFNNITDDNNGKDIGYYIENRKCMTCSELCLNCIMTT